MPSLRMRRGWTGPGEVPMNRKKESKPPVRAARPSPWHEGEPQREPGKTYEQMWKTDRRGRTRWFWREVTLSPKDVDDDCPMCRMMVGLPPKPLTEYKKPFEIATNLGSMGLGKPGEWDIVRHHGRAKGRKEPG